MITKFSQGHEIIANIAYGLLSKDIQSIVTQILFPRSNDNDDDDNSTSSYDQTKYSNAMGAVASWADKVRYTKAFAWTAPLHFIDIRDDLVPGGCPSTSTPIIPITADPRKESHRIHRHNGCIFSYDRDCGNGLCVANAIQTLSQRLFANQTNIHEAFSNKHFLDIHEQPQIMKQIRFLEGLSSSNQQHHLMNFTTRESLMFLIHFVGDIHQPLHVSRKSDIGGNKFHVTFPKNNVQSEFYSYFSNYYGWHQDRHHPYLFHEGWTLHSVWDTGMIEYKMKAGFNKSLSKYSLYIEDEYLTDENIKDWTKCSNGMNQTCVSNWAEESWDDALHWAYGDEKGNEIHDGHVITKEYIDSRIPIVESKLAAGGFRLAALLKMIFSK